MREQDELAHTLGREGELYRIIELGGVTFKLYYGYYEQRDRENPLCEPIPIDPDFQKAPEYTSDGFAFATDMQDACEHYAGSDPESGCFGCRYYKRGEEFLGICTCPQKRRNDIN